MLNEKFWAGYFEVYDVLNQVVPYQELLNEFVKKLKIENRDRILDVGGGTGNLAIILQKLGSEVTVLDFSQEALMLCKRKNQAIYTVWHNIIKKLPFPDNYFDKICSNNVLYTIQVEKRDFVMRELRRVLKDGGIIIVSNITTEFNPFAIYSEHIAVSLKKYGFFKTIYKVVKLLIPTFKMFYYNSKIKKENKEGDYKFLSNVEQKDILINSGFSDILEEKIVYADQGIMHVAKK